MRKPDYCFPTKEKEKLTNRICPPVLSPLFPSHLYFPLFIRVYLFEGEDHVCQG